MSQEETIIDVTGVLNTPLKLVLVTIICLKMNKSYNWKIISRTKKPVKFFGGQFSCGRDSFAGGGEILWEEGGAFFSGAFFGTPQKNIMKTSFNYVSVQ